jgi:NNP family nitrate/nitrite transporter-like MFS transporter
MRSKEAKNTPIEYALIVSGGFLAFFFLNVLNSSYSTVLEMIKSELALTYTMSGALMSSYFVGYLMGQIPWGIAADRFGSRRIIAASIGGAAVSTVVFSAARGFWLAMIARCFTGLLGAGVFVPSVKLVAEWFTVEKRGTALGILSIGGSVGLIASSWIIPSAAIQLGWRRTMSIVGGFGIIAAAAIAFSLKDKGSVKVERMSRGELSTVFRTTGFWTMAWTQFVRLGANYTFIAWLPLLLQEEYHLTLIAAGGVFSLFNLAGMAANPLGGFISDRIGEQVVLLTTFIGLSIVTILFIVGESPIFMYLTLIGIGWGINFIRSPHFAILPKLYGVQMAGQISGILNTFASAGALLLPLLLGTVRDITASYFMGWILLALILLSAGVASVTLKVSSGDGATQHNT